MFSLTDALKIKLFAGLAVVGVAAFVALLVYHGISVGLLRADLKLKQNTITQQETKISTLTGEIAQYKVTVDRLGLEIKDQNLKIDTMLSTAAQASKAAEAEIAKANAEASRWKTKLGKILDAPPMSSDQCTDLALRVDAYLKVRMEESQ